MIGKLEEAIFEDIGSPITLLFILVVGTYVLIRFLWKNWERLKKFLEGMYQSRKQREELYETVESLKMAKDEIVAETKIMSQNQKEFYNKQMEYRRISQELRDRLEKKTDDAIQRSEDAFKRSEETLNEIKQLKDMLQNIKDRQDDIKEKQDQIKIKQEEIDADRKAQKVNELRKDLIDAYRHFGLIENNPKQTWNEMESHAFWAMYNDYERYGGNDYAHEVIQPAMRKLVVVPISQED